MAQWSNIIGDQSTDIVDEDIMAAIENGDYSGLMKTVDGEMANGVSENSSVIEDAYVNTVDDGMDAANSVASVRAPQLGNNIIDGASMAIVGGSDRFINACTNLMNQGLDGMENAAKIQSPSKKTYGIGVYLVLGLINAIKAKTSSLVDTSGDMMSNTLDALRESMYTAFEYFDENVEYSPVISPVIDSRGMEYGLQNMQGLMGSYRYSSNVTPNVRYGQIDVGSAVGELGSLTSRGNGDILSELREQAAKTDKLIRLLETQKLYLDGHTVVGCMISDIDDQLGLRATMAGRRG